MKKLILLIVLAVLIIIAAVIFYPLLYKGTDEIVVVEDHNFLSLKDIVSQDRFKDKTVLVDIWGTTCKPCILEFDYAAGLKERYRDKPVDFIYLCTVNRIDHKIRWKDIIKNKELAGYHVPIDDKLYGAIWRNEIGDKAGSMFWIPRYCIIKNGEIIVYKAEQPSSKERLYNQIDSVLNLK